MALLHSRRHIEAMVWVLVGSLGVFGVKGGIFTILTGGTDRVWGPEASFIEGNNEIALALVMTIPLMYYLFVTAKNKWVRRAFPFAMLLSAAAALGSQSRGALIAIAAMALLLWWRAKNRVMGAILLGIVAIGLVAIMSATWEQRMNTIWSYEQDLSALQRLNAWEFCWKVATSNPILGGGYAIYTEDLYERYGVDPLLGLRNAHSIYFSVLGEHGFVGLALFLAIWISTWRAASWIRNRTSPDGELAWAYWLSSMLQVSVLGYLVGGAFLYLAYFDFPYDLLIVVAVTKVWVKRHLESGKQTASYRRHGQWQVGTEGAPADLQPAARVRLRVIEGR